MDSKEHPINVPAWTIDISKHGARLSDVRNWDSPGETVGLRYGNQKARYRIVWVGLPNSPVDGQVGLQCVEGKYIWDVALPIEEVEHTYAMASSTRTLVDHIGLPPQIPHYEDRRRKDRRFMVQGGANIREVGKNIPQWTTLHDLSLGGCYVETTAPLPADSRVEISIQVGDIRIDARAAVVVKHPLVGMGIKFGEMSPLDHNKLRHLIDSLEHSHSASAGR